MDRYTNELGQPIGFPIENWTQPDHPSGVRLKGNHCRLERLNADLHGADLHRANSTDLDNRIWTYLAYGPFDTEADYCQWIEQHCRGRDPLFYAIIDVRSAQAVGVASYLRITPPDGVIEVGHINYSPKLQKTVMATEAMFLMMRHVFDDLGYRRYEWKCDALNGPSRKAASRLGFTFEGIFRQATMYKQRNRDTAWFSITDAEWPAIRTAYQRWLSAENFDRGVQKSSLSGFMPTSKYNGV